MVKVNEVTPQMLETNKNVFIFDPDFEENEKSYERIKAEILGEESSSEGFLILVIKYLALQMITYSTIILIGLCRIKKTY